MDTAASEYATASEGGHIAVEEPGVPGKDNFIEYQDARDFLRAARELLSRDRSDDGLTADSRIAFDKLLNEVFATLDPPDPNRPLPSAEVRALIERAKTGLVK